jgi:hypothetical protein
MHMTESLSVLKLAACAVFFFWAASEFRAPFAILMETGTPARFWQGRSRRP